MFLERRFYLIWRLRLDRQNWGFPLSIIRTEKCGETVLCRRKIIMRTAGFALLVALHGGPANVTVAHVLIPTIC